MQLYQYWEVTQHQQVHFCLVIDYFLSIKLYFVPVSHCTNLIKALIYQQVYVTFIYLKQPMVQSKCWWTSNQSLQSDQYIGIVGVIGWFYLITDIPESAICWVVSNKKHQRYAYGKNSVSIYIVCPPDSTERELRVPRSFYSVKCPAQYIIWSQFFKNMLFEFNLK